MNVAYASGPPCDLLDAIRTVALPVAAEQAMDVDARARFPTEALAALREIGALSAAVPVALGGGGCGLRALAAQCSALAQGCGAAAMVLAMHHIQVACLVRHGLPGPLWRDYLAELARKQWLIASATSEIGTFGDLRSSVCALLRDGEHFTLEKQASTISYGAQADALLVTCRRAPEAAASEQVLVLLRREDYELEQTSGWDTLGMRGTCSPGFRLRARAPLGQVLPGAFADSAAQTMVPYSHVLWSAVWHGIAADALARAGGRVRAEARRTPGTVPAAAARLARAGAQLQSVRHHWAALAEQIDALGVESPGLMELLGLGWAVKLNHLKLSASENVVPIVHEALRIAGLEGYRNDSAFSIGRHFRDVLSAALMISNERIAEKSGSMLMLLKAELGM